MKERDFKNRNAFIVLIKMLGYQQYGFVHSYVKNKVNVGVAPTSNIVCLSGNNLNTRRASYGYAEATKILLEIPENEN